MPQSSFLVLPAGTLIQDDGLRYLSKPSGSPFVAVRHGVMSCFLCGRHLPLAELHGRRLAGRVHKVCRDTSACRSHRRSP